jgi:hypothetical protein
MPSASPSGKDRAVLEEVVTAEILEQWLDDLDWDQAAVLQEIIHLGTYQSRYAVRWRCTRPGSARWDTLQKERACPSEIRSAKREPGASFPRLTSKPCMRNWEDDGTCPGCPRFVPGRWMQARRGPLRHEDRRGCAPAGHEYPAYGATPGEPGWGGRSRSQRRQRGLTDRLQRTGVLFYRFR